MDFNQTKMKVLLKINIAILFLVLCSSCGKTTEQYAQKENGIKFDDWELVYTANDNYSIYWPKLRMTEDIKGEGYAITYRQPHSFSFTSQRDSSYHSINITPTIETARDRHDGSFYEFVRFYIDSGYEGDIYYCFINEGFENEISFASIVKESFDGEYYFNVNKDYSKNIISMLCDNKNLNIRIYSEKIRMYGKHHYEYTFTLRGSTNLLRGLKINKERNILAFEESKKN